MRNKKAGDSGTTMSVACNICGGTKFKSAPGGRLSVTNLPPVCMNCGSLERHRAFRNIFDKIRGPSFKKLSCLMFSKDPSVAGGWFASMRHSIYGTESSLDLQKIALNNAAVDVVICNHILEHVPRYQDALREISRIISDTGFAFVSFPNPHYRKVTVDWGYPKPEQHMHYRIFGADIEPKLKTILPGVGIVRVVGDDPVTATEDRGYIISKNNDFLGGIGERGLRFRYLHI